MLALLYNANTAMSVLRSSVPNLLASFLRRLARLRRNRVPNLIHDPSSSSPGAKDYHAHIRECKLADVKCGHDGGESHAAGALNVIVETCQVWLVALEDAPGVGEAEIFTAGGEKAR